MLSSVCRRVGVLTRFLPLLRAQCSRGDTSQTRLKIYTKKGDKGTTYNFSGQKLPKDHHIFEALGASDELTSMIGLAYTFCEEFGNTELNEKLMRVQCVLQEAASSIATPRHSTQSQHKLNQTVFDGKQVEILEEWIDALDSRLPPLKNFILPSGGRTSAVLHVARSICRRAERRLVPLVRDGEVDMEVGRYFNRLSDFLFVSARFAAHCEGKNETVYRKNLN
ncbi:corrinoid adenosyltransferase MMAB-like [Corticium candelabrum]|uniref:corrinoid adenosyltransferase MMAB-like n=1 Tax=Corticium candelabrum TaxID=121492 RepID=UPI002E26F478|nr:corrinoid adenosyltransferase MMAB-like [Corticium candelabrum]